MIEIKFGDIVAAIKQEPALAIEEAIKKRDKIALDLLAELQNQTPVDTGRARQSWSMTKSAEKATVGSDCEYMLALNNGHSTQAPAGFIENSIDKVSR